MSSKVFLTRHEFVHRVVTLAAKRNCFTHLFSREVLLEPLVAVAGSRNQMMFCRAFFRLPMAQSTLGKLLVHLLHARWIDLLV